MLKIIHTCSQLPDVDWEMGTAGGRSGALVEAADDAMLEQLITFPTQVRGNILDLVFTNMPERVSDITEEGRLGQSDHSLIMLKVSSDSGPEVIKQVRNWRRADWDGMRKDLKREKWERNLREKTVAEMWEVLKKKVLGAVKKSEEGRQGGVDDTGDHGGGEEEEENVEAGERNRQKRRVRRF